ncbi:MAG TPA: RHS repeat-associated core domain-containing protein, partial [Promineifilum sp.]|nr:RHS repeat-associated core domain-containing protein [Promineifilum sp.]
VVTPGNEVHFIHTDHLGRPESATRADKARSWSAVNLSYHRTVAMDTIGGISLGFPGQTWDEETGTWHNGFRDYDPHTGRYIQSDPIGLGGGANTYAYAGGNPIIYVDPYGLHCLTPEEIGMLSGALEGGIAGAQGGPWAALGGAVIGGGVGWITSDRGETAGLVASGMTGAVTAIGEGKSGMTRGGVSAVVGMAGAGTLGPLGAAMGPMSGELASPSSSKFATAFANAKRASAFGVTGAAAGLGLRKLLESTRDANCDCK